MVHKRLRNCNTSSFTKSCVVRNTNGQNSSSNYITSNPITPTSPTRPPPGTMMQLVDCFVDPSAVTPHEAVSLAEEMAADFYSEISIMYDMLSDIKIPTDEGRAVDELMRRLHILLSANANGHHTDRNLSTQITHVRGLYNGLIRVFVFLYQRYYRAFVVLEVNELLTASWQRLLAFVIEYHILDEMFVRKVYDHVAEIVGSP
ncbi:unnamed protein product [Peronospora belbahrii]|uniref:Uncharacterized protein n=1 Tax=Peronospora belbahrii TaxID=622444 RepID=A0AAU9L4P9_9STRA|nr:unnamed protein product [Peronospora belbahrii]CAH0519252.1 unnamed protein product [Peronospora belbahrii]